MFLFLVGLSTAGTTAYLGYKEYQANKKRNQLIQYVNYLTKDMKTNESIHDALLIGAGSTALSVFSIYSMIENHSEVLDIMEYRYPNALMDMSPLEWLTKVEQLYNDGDQALNGFISGYAGQAAETITVEQFEAMGASATLFESRTHANDDIAVTMNGETIHYSVKSYSDSDSFAQAVSSHPDSTHYVVNQELYTQLESKGLLEQYQSQGITIIEGNYSNVALREEASKAFLDIHEAADVADHIPFISAPLFALRSGFNIKAYREGKQSGRELTVNVVSDAGKIGVASGLGYGGAQLGSLIGTAFLPGIGTVVGGGIGAVLGAFAGSKLMDSVKTYFKWGKIIAIQEEVGETFKRIGYETYKQFYLSKLFNYQLIEEKANEAHALQYRFTNKVDLYRSEQVTLPAVLHMMYIDHIEHVREGITKSAELLPYKVEQFASQCAEKMKKPQAKNAFIGELLLQSNGALWYADDDKNYENKKREYGVATEKNPNYPYQYQVEADDIVEHLVQETVEEQLKPKQFYSFLMQEEFKYRKPIIILTLITLVSFIVFFSR